MSSSLTTTVVITIALLAGGNASPPIRRSPTADVPTSASTVSSSLVSSVSTAFHPLSRAESAPARTSTSATSPSWPAAAVVSPSPTPTWTSTKSLTGASRLSPCLPVDLAVPLLALVLMALSGAIVTGDEEPAPRPTTPPPRPIADRRRGRLLVGKANAFAQVQRRAAARRPPWRP
ncbi:Uncharacterized protein PBTT_08024 [Plasmodiophora brassicae]